MIATTPIKSTPKLTQKQTQQKPASGLTLRSLIIGIIFAILTVWLVSYAELVTGQIMIGYLQAPPAAVFLLFVVTIINLICNRIAPKLALRSTEMATVYIMMVPAALIASHGLLQRILPAMVAGNYFANNSNNWQALYFSHTPSWLVVWDTHGAPKQPVTAQFYHALKRGATLPWQAWFKPLVSWLTLFAMVYGVFFAMAAILRKQWVENEHLTFPLIQLPLELLGHETSDQTYRNQSVVGAFFSSKIAWAGFALPFIVFGINGLHHIWPVIPLIRLTFAISPLATTSPWNGISYTTLNFSFAAVGFFFLLPTEMLFSFWVFYLLAKVEEVAYAAAGNLLPDSPHADSRLMIGAQTEGAWISLVFVYLAAAKPHLKEVWEAVISKNTLVKGDDEMLSYRAAFWLMVSCLLGIVIWCVVAGMSAWLVVCVFGLYLFVQALVLARTTAEGGLIMTEGCWTPSDIIGLGVPLHDLGPANLTLLSYIDVVFTRDLRSMMLTVFVDMQKFAETIGLKLKSLRTALLVSLLVSIIFGSILQIWLPYHLGANTLYDYMYDVNATQFFREYAPYMKPIATPPSYGSQWYLLLGVVVTVGLGILRARVSWWPLHPLGYALAGSWTIVVFWLSMLVAWTLKSAVLRYGGIKMYRLVRPFFIGMILGELTSAGFWTLIASFTHATAPQFPWP